MRATLVRGRAEVLFDQMVVSGGNFGFTLVLARLLDLEDFGRFSLVWLGLLFLNGLHFAALSMPMFTLSATLTGPERERYFGSVMVHQHRFDAAVFGACLLGWALAQMLWSPSLFDAFLVAAVSAANHRQEFYRRYFFCEEETGRALAIDGVAYVARFLPLVVFALTGTVGVPGALVALGSGFALAAALGRWLAGPLPRPDDAAFSEHSREQWQAARYLLPSALLQWTSVSFPLAVAGAVVGASAVGVIRLGQTLVNTGNVFLQALENVLPIRVARLHAEQGARATLDHMGAYLLRGLLIIALVAVPLVLFAPQIMTLFGSEYRRYGYILHWLAPMFGFAFLHVGMRVLVRTFQITRAWLSSYVVASVVTLVSFYPLQSRLGIVGVLMGMALAYVVQLAVAWRAVRRAATG